jgi:hypothetical protein
VQLFEVLKLSVPELSPHLAKLHLATDNGSENPLDVYLAGHFAQWQSRQTKLNFKRRFVVSLIALPEANKWLFAGLYESHGAIWQASWDAYQYTLSEVAEAAVLNGRVIVQFQRPGRQSSLNADAWSDQLVLCEMRPERLQVAGFPGYRKVQLSYTELCLICKETVQSWEAALKSVAGVYLISDTKTGKLYVGSASGKGGIWQRWQQYATTGHGGNAHLRALANGDLEHFKHFRFSVLEIAELHEDRDSILQREAHWKTILMSKEYGLNAN